MGYASANETAHITLVRVHKGGRIRRSTAARYRDGYAGRCNPRGSTLQRSEGEASGGALAFGRGHAGDEVHTTIDKAEAPGQFWGATHFTAPGTVVVLAEVVNLEVPKDNTYRYGAES